jgi:rhamnogalacturonan acetylesterase
MVSFNCLFFIVQLVSLAVAGPTPTKNPPALYLCSDSTAANYNPQTTPIQGFYPPLHHLLI